jgi:hypothetical protein
MARVSMRRHAARNPWNSRLTVQRCRRALGCEPRMCTTELMVQNLGLALRSVKRHETLFGECSYPRSRVGAAAHFGRSKHILRRKWISASG